MDFDEFQRWLKRGVSRAPNLYSGQVVHEAVSEAKKAISVAKKPIGEVMAKERIDWQSKAAGEEVWDANEEGL